MKRIRLALLLAPLALSSFAAFGQPAAYPTKPIHMVVPFAPGGPTDAIARLAAEAMSRKLGQTVVVENKPGAGGRIGLEAIAAAPNDGYNIGFVAGTLSSLQAFFKDWKRDVGTTYTYIGSLVESSPVVWASPSVPGKTLAEALAHYKANPGKLNIVYTAPGVHELLIMHLDKKWGLKSTRVAFKGEGEAKMAVMTGDVHMMFGSMSAHMPDYRAGKLKLFAVTGTTRSPDAPDVPTLTETKVADTDMSLISPFGVIAPANLPPEIAARLSRALFEGIQEPDLMARLRNFSGFTFNLRPGDNFRDFTRKQTDQVNKLAKEYDLVAQ